MPEPRFIPPRESPPFARWLERWCRRHMIRKKFHALLLERESGVLLRSLAEHEGPVILAANHVGWWDPLVMHTLHRAFMDARSMRAPMDADQLERFGLFRRLGVFGINPDDPASLGRMGEEMGRYFTQHHRPTFWITPQGRFADVRQPVVVRPGVSKLAASTPGVRVIAVAVEYCFWTDPKPEILVRAREVLPEAEPRSTTVWQRTISDAMVENGASLAALAIGRDATRFDPVVSRAGRQGGLVYDLWLRLRGRGGGISATRHPTRNEATA